MRNARHVRLDRGLLQLGIVSLTFLLAAVAVNAQQTTECNHHFLQRRELRRPNASTRKSISDLRSWGLGPYTNKNWNNRIGSIRIY